jgi:hypothetical protein
LIRSAILAASGLAVPLLLFTLVGGAQVGPRPLGLVAMTTLGTLAIAACALFAAFGRGRSMLGRTSGWLLVTARNRACRVPDLEGGRQLRHAPPDGPLA